MPRGPNGEKRPADPIACAVKVARVATGEEQDPPKREPKLTPEQRSEQARKAARARWDK